ncbi:MAG: RluA family pseudouridine synthase [Candidatus Omnitrophica bacterium]|nr:RluA family pseudouridine synthase [Candidatus Omnitrophota bacterium]
MADSVAVFSPQSILYEDNHLLVVIKPAGMLSQSDISKDPDILTELKNYLRVTYDKPGNVFLGLVHRLDRPVGGVMVFARTSKAASRLCAQLRGQTWNKIYLAIVQGVMEKEQGMVEHYLAKNWRRNTVSVLTEAAEGSKYSRLTYRVLGTVENLSLLEVTLHTGRAHQIRAQLSAIGYPLWGDCRYGMPTGANREAPMDMLSQPALWAYRLEFDHPISQERQRFVAPPPQTIPWKYFFTVLRDFLT